MWYVHMNFRPKIAVLLSSHILRNHAHGCSQCWSLTCLIPEGLCVLSLCLCLKIYFSGIKMSSPLNKRSYMYLSSDSLRTRMSLIRTILHNSPSMSSTVMVESAIETTSTVAKRHNQKSVTKQVTKAWTYLFWVIYTGLIRTQRTQFN